MTTQIETEPLESKTTHTKMNFVDEVISNTPGEARLRICIQCGTCGGSCPSAPDMDHTPRAIFALMMAEKKDEFLRSNTPWYCVSCYYCMVRCPQDIHITDIMYTLKRYSLKAGLYKEGRAADAPGFSQTFIDFVENYGRSFELGVATLYNLAHHPLGVPKMAPMGIGMLRKGRMDLTPKKIKGIDQLKAILTRANEIGGGVG